MENEHRQTSRDTNPGLIERDLVGSQIASRNQTNQPRRQSNPNLQNNNGQSATANSLTQQAKPAPAKLMPKSKAEIGLIGLFIDRIFR
jgi:hypothetical protein